MILYELECFASLCDCVFRNLLSGGRIDVWALMLALVYIHRILMLLGLLLPHLLVAYSLLKTTHGHTIRRVCHDMQYSRVCLLVVTRLILSAVTKLWRSPYLLLNLTWRSCNTSSSHFCSIVDVEILFLFMWLIHSCSTWPRPLLICHQSVLSQSQRPWFVEVLTSEDQADYKQLPPPLLLPQIWCGCLHQSILICPLSTLLFLSLSAIWSTKYISVATTPPCM